MLVIFPFEKDWYEQRGFPVKYVGHPIFDDWEPTSKTELCKLLQLNETLPIITLYPGSRIQEINRHLPFFLEVANQINAYDNADFPAFIESLPREGPTVLSSFISIGAGNSPALKTFAISGKTRVPKP